MKKRNWKSKINKAKQRAARAQDINWDIPSTIPDNMRYVVKVLYWDDDPHARPEHEKHLFRRLEDAKKAIKLDYPNGVVGPAISIEKI